MSSYFLFFFFFEVLFRKLIFLVQHTQTKIVCVGVGVRVGGYNVDLQLESKINRGGSVSLPSVSLQAAF